MPMNFARDVVEAARPRELALVELAPRRRRREWSFGEVARRSAAMAATLARLGVRRGDVVLTLVGNRPEWVLHDGRVLPRAGAVVLPCTEQLRAKDLRLRLDVARPAPSSATSATAASWRPPAPDCPVLLVPDARARSGPIADAPPHAELDDEDPCLDHLHERDRGRAEGRRPRPALPRRPALQAEHWLDARPGELVWCTAASGWSKSARNVFIAPWIRGAAGAAARRPLRPARAPGDPRARAASRSCAWRRPSTASSPSAPSRARSPALRGLVAAGEALNPEVLRAWHEATGLWIRDGYGQTETGQTHRACRSARAPRARARWAARCPGVRLWVDDGELCLDPPTVPTFFRGYLGGRRPPRRGRAWRTGDRVDAGRATASCTSRAAPTT